MPDTTCVSVCSLLLLYCFLLGTRPPSDSLFESSFYVGEHAFPGQCLRPEVNELNYEGYVSRLYLFPVCFDYDFNIELQHSEWIWRRAYKHYGPSDH